MGRKYLVPRVGPESRAVAPRQAWGVPMAEAAPLGAGPLAMHRGPKRPPWLPALAVAAVACGGASHCPCAGLSVCLAQ